MTNQFPPRAAAPVIKRDSLPESYVPYRELVFCTNRLIDVSVIMDYHSVVPLLVGRGPVPQVWLQAPTNAQGTDFRRLVTASVSMQAGVQVKADANGLSVLVAGQRLLHVRGISQESAEVDLLDLRPIGLEVHGDDRSLHVANIELAFNTVEGGGGLLTLG